MARVGDVLHAAGDSGWCEQHPDPHLGAAEARPGSRRRDPLHRHGPLFRVRGRLGSCVRGRHTSDLPCVALGAPHGSLAAIDASDPAPKGWSGPIAPVHLGNGITYVTYWLLTPR